jgi:hypothetical protein
LEGLLPQTILQMFCLQKLYLGTKEGFKIVVLISWLLHAQDSHSKLSYGLIK